jgi:hypothetical protein
LARGAAIDRADRQGLTPLHWAVERQQFSCVQVMIKWFGVLCAINVAIITDIVGSWSKYKY